MAEQQDLPVQPVNSPVICSPYYEPQSHWRYDEHGEAQELDERRPSFYWYKEDESKRGRVQADLFASERTDELVLVNMLRDDVRRWRKSGYETATKVTKQLLAHWNRAGRPRRLFFCQREAVETAIYLNEILGSRSKKLRWNTRLSFEDFQRLRAGQRPSFLADGIDYTVIPTLLDVPADDAAAPLSRYCCKMATGSGKTVVMAMLLAWAFCNRGRMSSDDRFPAAALVLCPNLTIKERLQVLRPDTDDNYFEAFDIVPTSLLPELHKGKVIVENWHQLALESEHTEMSGGKKASFKVVNKGEESPDAFARRVLGDLYDGNPIMVLNDEAHHAYRPAPVEGRVTGAEKKDREEATIWVQGLDRINAACGVKFCIDLTATPFYLHGSGYVEGSPFPWIVSDFGLVDAIESGITKIPRLPVSDTTGRPEPKYFHLWRHITDNLEPGEKLPGGKPKPDVVWREAEDAMTTLASQWKERYQYIEERAPGQENTPPVMIVVCDNTDIAQVFFERTSGERVIEVEVPPTGKSKKPKKRKETLYEGGLKGFSEFHNRASFRPTLRIDTKLLDQVESEDPSQSKSEVAEELRQTIASIGKPGTKGHHVRAVVSVQMLTEGWDANNVTHILGLRAFTSQLLCEQVVGRGLRRMDYNPDPETGLLPEEYVDVYGIPFSIIPFRGRPTKTPAPEDKPKNEVRAVPERVLFEIRFPIVEGYVFALRKNLITADIDGMELLVIEPEHTPTAVYVKPQVGIQVGGAGPAVGGFETYREDRSTYYQHYHIQTIKFEIARQIVRKLTEEAAGMAPKMRLQSRHQLFPQVLKLVNEFVAKKVDWRGEHKSELGLEKYVTRTVERLVDAITPNESEGETPLLPILNRYKPMGSTSDVHFKTTRPVHPTIRSHINQVVLDTGTWERAAAFRLEQCASVAFYARNDHMEFTIPYEYQGLSHNFVPDYLVRLKNDLTVVVEIKGFQDDRVRAKHQAAKKWAQAVNNWGRLGRWHFHVCTDPQLLDKEMDWLFGKTNDESVQLVEVPQVAEGSPPLTDVEDMPLFRTEVETEGAADTGGKTEPLATAVAELEAKHITIEENETGHSYEALFGEYTRGAKTVTLVDPYIRFAYQYRNLVRFADILVPDSGYVAFHLVTAGESLEQEVELSERFDRLQQQLAAKRVRFTYGFDSKAHDRWIQTDTGWRITLGRGLDFFQRPRDRYSGDWDDYTLRRCKGTTLTFVPVDN